MAEFSTLIVRELDNIGYRDEIIKIRRNLWKEKQTNSNTGITNHILQCIYAGSKAEGITSIYQNDVDVMFLVTKAICTENVELLSEIQGMTLIHCDTREAPPGYTRLKLINSDVSASREYLRECKFESESGNVYLSSSLFVTSVKQSFTRNNQIWPFTHPVGNISGPAVPLIGIVSHDNVLAFRCYYARSLQTWKSRRRLHEWPPADVREDAASMIAQVVPVGSKGSCDQWREWRFCFIESELKLTYSLNETQLKLYIVLKMVAKEILSYACDEISSYIMKNIIFWLSELLPKVVFRKENFITLLLLSLRFLNSAISIWNWLPYYMIPGRNLLAERLTPASRRQLSNLIETLIQEGPQFILRCEKLRMAVYIRLAAPDLMVKYGEARDKVERLVYCRRHIKRGYAVIPALFLVEIELLNIVLPEWGMLLLRGIPPQIIVDMSREKIRSFLL